MGGASKNVYTYTDISNRHENGRCFQKQVYADIPNNHHWGMLPRKRERCMWWFVKYDIQEIKWKMHRRWLVTYDIPRNKNWFDLTWIELTWLDLNWLDLNWLDLIWKYKQKKFTDVSTIEKALPKMWIHTRTSQQTVKQEMLPRTSVCGYSNQLWKTGNSSRLKWS